MEDFTDIFKDLRGLITIYETIEPSEPLLKSEKELKELTGTCEDIGLPRLLIKALDQILNGYKDHMDDVKPCDEVISIYKEIKKGIRLKKSKIWWKKLYYKCKTVKGRIATKTTAQELKQEEIETNLVIIKHCLMLIFLKIMPFNLD